MRALFWILGAVASAAGGAYLLDRRAKRRLSDGFLAALRQGPVVVHAYRPAIIAPGFRVEIFAGECRDKKPFVYAARADASGTKWTFALEWNGSRIILSWNPVADGIEHPLKQAYDILRRRASKGDGLSN